MNKIGLNEDTLDKTTRLYIDEQDKRIAQLEEEIAILHEAGGIDAKDRDHLREVIQERNQKIDELTKRVEHEATKFAVAFAAKCKAEQDRADLEKENAELKEKLKTAYRKGMRHMAKALKDYDRTDGAWTDYFEHTVDKVLQREQLDFEEYRTLADQLIKAKDLLKQWVELFKPKGGNFPPTPIQVDTEQFLNSEVEK